MTDAPRPVDALPTDDPAAWWRPYVKNDNLGFAIHWGTLPPAEGDNWRPLYPVEVVSRLIAELAQAQKAIEALNICIKQDDERERTLTAELAGARHLTLEEQREFDKALRMSGKPASLQGEAPYTRHNKPADWLDWLDLFADETGIPRASMPDIAKAIADTMRPAPPPPPAPDGLVERLNACANYIDDMENRGALSIMEEGARKLFREAAAALAPLAGREGWRDIKSAPTDGTPVLLHWGGALHHVVGHYEQEWGSLGFDWGFSPFPTQPKYWLPLEVLPAAPSPVRTA